MNGPYMNGTYANRVAMLDEIVNYLLGGFVG